MPVPGVDWIPHSRNMLSWARQWGTPFGQNFRSVLNSVIPVSVVDRYRDNEEGSVYGMTVDGPDIGLQARFAACVFSSIDNDVEFHVHSVNWWYGIDSDVASAVAQNVGVQMFIPIAPFNPVVTDTVGLFVPGLITDEQFTFGSVRALAGSSNSRPAIDGFFLDLGTEVLSNANPWGTGTGPRSSGWWAQQPNGEVTGRDRRSQNTRNFDPPIRVRTFESLAFQLNLPTSGAGPRPVDIIQLGVSILYTERRLLR
jgi:hypothetical protein